MVPRAVVDALMEQLSTLQATVDRLTALLEEKEQIIRNQTVRDSGRAVRSGRIFSATVS